MPYPQFNHSDHSKMPPARHPRPAASSSTTTNTQPPSLPQYEPPTAPLNPAAKRALAGLLESHTVRRLKDHIRHAGEKLTDSAGEVNERVTDERVRHEKRTTRDREAGKEEDEDEKENLEKREEEVRNITADLDKGMRGIVDSDVKLAGLVGGIGHLERDAERESGVGGPPVEVLRERIAREGEEWEGRSLVDRYGFLSICLG